MTLLTCRLRNLGRDAPRPTLSKRRGGKSQGKGEAVHKSEASGRAAGNQALEVGSRKSEVRSSVRWLSMVSLASDFRSLTS